MSESETSSEWKEPELTKEQIMWVFQECIVFGFSAMYNGSHLQFHHDFFSTLELGLGEGIDFLVHYEENFKNEVWFQQADIDSRRKIISGRS